jgi:myo-inositol-1(or 4)-monophosphatase
LPATVRKTEGTSLSHDLATMRLVAREAGCLAMDFKRRGETKAWEKSPGHPVTEADLAVNALLACRLGAARSQYGWLSEETVDDPANRAAGRVWVVDPIDGTRAFMQGDPNWCVGLAVVERGAAVAGVIYAPEYDALYEARLGGGAYLNGNPIAASNCAALEDCRMIASQSVLGHKDWPVPWPPLEIARPKPNATLLRLALIASGAWDATLALGRKSDWDLAPGEIILSEAGGLATAHDGAAFVYNRTVPAQRSLIAAGKRLHPLLVERTSVVRLPDPNAAERSADLSTS